MKILIWTLGLLFSGIVSLAQGNFIEFLDGKRLDLDKEPIEEVVPLFKKPFLKAGNKKYESKTVKGYQSDSVYYLQKDGLFFKRVTQGKINSFQRTEYTTDDKGRRRTFTIYYLQKGENSEWIIYSKKDFIKLVSDNPEAKSMAEANRDKLFFSKHVLDIIELYNKP